MRRLDTNGSGQIDFTEFIVAADTHNRLVCRETLETAFSYFDKVRIRY
jgi:Ca2+-binding EF-hand superfamily protein